MDVTHALTDNGGYRRVPFSGRRKALAAEYSPIGDPNALNTGLFTSSTMASNFLPIDAADVVIWDRVPSQDLKEMELPSKVLHIWLSLHNKLIVIFYLRLRWNGLLARKVLLPSRPLNGIPTLPLSSHFF